MRKENMYLITGILAIIWSFLASVMMFKVYMYIENSCNVMRLGIAFFSITILIGILTWCIRKKETEEAIDEEADESEDSKKD